MTQHDDFRSQRDRAIGGLLQEHLRTTDDSTFARGVMARIRRESSETSWEVLAGWAPVGVAAAVLLALATGLWLGSGRADAPSVVAQTADPVEWLSTGEPMTTEFVLTAVLAGDEFDVNGVQR